MIKRKNRFLEYASAMHNASAEAQDVVSELIRNMPTEDPDTCKEIILTAVPAIIEKYGDIASAAACEYYEAVIDGRNMEWTE